MRYKSLLKRYRIQGKNFYQGQIQIWTQKQPFNMYWRAVENKIYIGSVILVRAIKKTSSRPGGLYCMGNVLLALSLTNSQKWSTMYSRRRTALSDSLESVFQEMFRSRWHSWSPTGSATLWICALCHVICGTSALPRPALINSPTVSGLSLSRMTFGVNPAFLQ